jgi:hypothetical protein
MHSHSDCHSARAKNRFSMNQMPSELVGVAGSEPAASLSRSQVPAQTASAAARLAWDTPSVDVRWRPPLAVAIVTHFVTQPLYVHSGGNYAGICSSRTSRRSSVAEALIVVAPTHPTITMGCLAAASARLRR